MHLLLYGAESTAKHNAQSLQRQETLAYTRPSSYRPSLTNPDAQSGSSGTGGYLARVHHIGVALGLGDSAPLPAAIETPILHDSVGTFQRREGPQLLTDHAGIRRRDG